MSIGGVSQLAYARPYLTCNICCSMRLVSQCESRFTLPPLPLFLTSFLSSVTMHDTVLNAMEEPEMIQLLPLPQSSWTHLI